MKPTQFDYSIDAMNKVQKALKNLQAVAPEGYAAELKTVLAKLADLETDIEDLEMAFGTADDARHCDDCGTEVEDQDNSLCDDCNTIYEAQQSEGATQ